MSPLFEISTTITFSLLYKSSTIVVQNPHATYSVTLRGCSTPGAQSNQPPGRLLEEVEEVKEVEEVEEVEEEEKVEKVEEEEGGGLLYQKVLLLLGTTPLLTFSFSFVRSGRRHRFRCWYCCLLLLRVCVLSRFQFQH